jgi:hypothetical protein
VEGAIGAINFSTADWHVGVEDGRSIESEGLNLQVDARRKGLVAAGPIISAAAVPPRFGRLVQVPAAPKTRGKTPTKKPKKLRPPDRRLDEPLRDRLPDACSFSSLNRNGVDGAQTIRAVVLLLRIPGEGEKDSGMNVKTIPG